MAEGARLEIVYTPKAYPGFKSQTLRQQASVAPSGATFFHNWRGGRAAECGGLENRLPVRGYVSSNLTLSARRVRALMLQGSFHIYRPFQESLMLMGYCAEVPHPGE